MRILPVLWCEQSRQYGWLNAPGWVEQSAGSGRLDLRILLDTHPEMIVVAYRVYTDCRDIFEIDGEQERLQDG